MRATDAANRAISSPLLEDASVNGARGVIVNVTGGPDMALMEVNEALTIIQEAAHEDANIIFGAVVDPQLHGRVKITVIATGFDHVRADRSIPAGAAGGMQTPVDMGAYASHARTINVPAAQEGNGGSPRVLIARRQGLDMGSSRPLPRGMGQPGGVKPEAQGEGPDAESHYDVPAFLRRSEG